MITEIVKQVTVKKWEYKGQEYSALPDCRCAELIKMIHGDCQYCKYNSQPWQCEGCKYGMGICEADKWELKEIEL